MATRKTDTKVHAADAVKPAPRKGGPARPGIETTQERIEIAQHAAQRGKRGRGGTQSPPTVIAPRPAPAEKNGGGSAPSGEIPRSLYQGRLRIGQLELECHVLSDGKRVFTQGEATAARRGAAEEVELKTFLSRVPPLPGAAIHDPDVRFLAPKARTPGTGYEATYLVDVANTYLKARDEGRLSTAQVPLAKHAEIVMRALAKVGITALIDSATGFEQVRLKRALQLELQVFIAHDLQDWAMTFPEEFWSELARLEGIRYSPRSRPLRWGRYVMLFVYDAIDQDLESRIKTRKPELEFRADHRHLLDEFSKDHLHRHLARIVTIMKQCSDMAEFRIKLERVFKRVPAEVGFPQAV